MMSIISVSSSFKKPNTDGNPCHFPLLRFHLSVVPASKTGHPVIGREALEIGADSAGVPVK
ncbi:MAG TPA: hypothetical protein VFW59_02615 [Gallionella sp.]|nr:hypothetical protein [Gallionella sp.]